MAQTQLPGSQIKDADLKNVDIAADAAIDISKLALPSSLPDKATPVDADVFTGGDSAASNVWKKFTWANIKATLKTYFDTLYGSMNNPMTTSGDIIYGGTSGAPTRLAKGTDTQVLTLASGLPSWANPAGGGTDPRQTMASLFTTSLLHFDGSNASTTIIDATGKNVWTANGDAQLSTAQKKFGTASLLLDGAGDYIDAPDSENFTLGANDFTIEVWVRRNSTGRHKILGQMDSGGTISSESIDIEFTASNYLAGYACYGSSYKAITGSTPITNDGTWHHIALVRSQNTLYLFLDGVSQGTPADMTGITINNSSNKFSIGRAGEYANLYFNGWIDEFRFVKGFATYTEAFTLPTSAFTNRIENGIFTAERIAPANSVPIMTSNTAPSGVASASSIYSSTYDAWKAFDKVNSTQWVNNLDGLDNFPSVPQWLQYKFATLKVITKYIIQPRISNNGQSPSGWTFQGSNDGTNWTTLDTQTGITFSGDVAQSFRVYSVIPYLYFRLYMTAGGSANAVSIGELELWGQEAGGDGFDPTTTVEFMEEFTGSSMASGGFGWDVNAVSGTVDGPYAVTANANGEIRLNSGATIGNGVALQRSALGYDNTSYYNSTTIIRLRNVGAAGNYGIRIGLALNGAVGDRDGIYFRAGNTDYGLSNTNWHAVTRTSSTETRTDTGINQSTSYKQFKIVVNSNATSIGFYIDGVLKATHTTNIPSDSLLGRLQIDTNTNTQYQVYIDYFYFKVTGLTR